MKKKIVKRLVTAVLSAAVILTMTGVQTALASDTYTSETMNHGTMTVSAEQEGTAISVSAGEEIAIRISPYQHIQYTGCATTPKCPDVCGSEDDCFIVGKGCKCDTEPLLRTADVTVTSSDPEVVAEGEKKADSEIGEATQETVAQTVNGTLTLKALKPGTSTVKVETKLRDWVSAEETYEITVTEAVKKLDVTDMNAWTTYVLNEAGDNAVQTLHVELTFDQELTVKDADALTKEVTDTIAFGSGLNAEKTTVTLERNGKTVLIESSGWGAQVAGYFTAKGTWTNLVAADGSVAAPDVKFLVPNGLTTKIVEQSIATETEPASVTTQIVQPEGCTRGMVHLVLLKNGQPVVGADGSLDQYGGTFTSHFHDFLNMGATGFTKNFVPSLIDQTKDRYTVDYTEGSDTFTVKAVSSQPGDILEFHVFSYANDGTKKVDLSDLNAAITKAETLTGDAAKDANVLDTLAKAKLIAKDATYYSEDDAAAAASALLNAVTEAKYAQAQQTGAVTFSSYKISAYREADKVGVEDVSGCHIVVEAAFDGKLELSDSKAAAASFQGAKGISVMGLNPNNMTVSVDGSVLKLDAVVTFMPGGILAFDTVNIDGITCDGKAVYWPKNWKTVAPTGLSLEVTDVSIGTKTTPASTTIRVLQPACVRSMNHILWTSNGASIMEGTGIAQTTTAHHHAFYSMTAVDSAATIAGNATNQMGEEAAYTFTAQDDTVTITAKTAVEGEYLGIYNYDDNFLQANKLSLADTVEGLPALTVAQPEQTEAVEIGGISLAKTSYTYTGKEVKPAVTVKDSDGNVIDKSNYTVTYSNNKNAGTATVTVSGKGENYTGSKSLNFTIAKAGQSLKVKAAKKTLSAKKKAKTVISAKKAFKVSGAKGTVTYKKTKGNKKITVASNGKITVKKGLKKGTYTVKVKVTSAATKNYKAAKKTVALKIKVK